MSSVQYLLTALALVVAVQALSDDVKDKIHQDLKPIVQTCAKESSISEEDLKAAKDNGKIFQIDPCFHACVFKKIGMIDDKGMFDVDVAIENNNKYLKDDESAREKANELSEKICSKVNDEAVSDGDKGCDRAKLLIKCFIDNDATSVFNHK